MRRMDEAYWNDLAQSYDNEVFDVCANDRQHKVASRIERFSASDKVASDLGCGIGKFLEPLAQGFRQVFAVDFSRDCLDRARQHYGQLENVTFVQADLSQGDLALPQVNFALSVNAVITPSLTRRNGILKTVESHLVPGGHFALVVPSVESALLSHYRLIEWNQRRGLPPGTAQMAGLPMDQNNNARNLLRGIVDIDSVPTKHYLEEELQVELSRNNLEVQEMDKIEYEWNTEFTDPPSWMQEPYPWDWLVVAQKKA